MMVSPAVRLSAAPQNVRLSVNVFQKISAAVNPAERVRSSCLDMQVRTETSSIFAQMLKSFHTPKVARHKIVFAASLTFTSA